MASPVQVAVLGYGEVGHVLACGLAAPGAPRVYDPAHPPSPSGGPPLVACNAEAVRGADVVIAVTTGADSLAACVESRPISGGGLRGGGGLSVGGLQGLGDAA
ncbi:hypothetical protein [Nonomuraea jabiensis]|uniref:hypothetical protein n=1 Tax=Nonomuraea jabiensis TaxID=882448 RepID=UPI003D71ACA8